MKTVRVLIASIAAIALLTACENVQVTWEPAAVQEYLEQDGDCRVHVDPQERGSVIFRLADCDPRTIAELQLGNGDILLLSGPTRQIWAPNPRRVQHEYFVRARYIEGQRFNNTYPRVIIGFLHYRW